MKNLDATEILETKVIELEKTEVLETVVIDTKKIKEVKNRKVKKENKIEEPKEVVAEKIEEELSSFNTFDEKQKTKEKVTDLTKAQQIYVIKKKLKKKKINNFFVVIILLLSLGYIGYNFANNIDNFGHIVKGNEKIEEVSFNMGDMITYKDIKYVINSVEESTGTAYKKPKKNNIYLIVSLSLENKSNEKHHYSGKYFTMLNSKGEEAKRIISPVNAGEDLYSGNLVVGGKKDGSLVFEVPKDDEELFLQYYNPQELEEYEVKLEEQDNIENEEDKEQIKKPTPKFRVKININ